MKKFDREAAIQGAEVQTKSGLKAKISTFGLIDDDYDLIVHLEDQEGDPFTAVYTHDGFYNASRTPSDLDLFMASKTGWINIYNTCDDSRYVSSSIYSNEEQAVKNATEGIMATIKIEWEE